MCVLSNQSNPAQCPASISLICPLLFISKLALSLTSEFMVQRPGTRPQSHIAAFLSHSLTFFTILNFVDLNSSDMIMFQLWLHVWDRMLHGAGDLWTNG